MGLRKALAHTVMHLSRWTFAPEFPLPDRCLVIGAPHTSNWDGFYMVMAMWAVERPVSFLVKKNLTDVPVIGSLTVNIRGTLLTASFPLPNPRTISFWSLPQREPVPFAPTGNPVSTELRWTLTFRLFPVSSMARSIATGGVSQCDSPATAVTTWTKSAISTVGWWGFAQKTPASPDYATKIPKTKVPRIFALKSVL